jgi:transcription antitermination factor NusG
MSPREQQIIDSEINRGEFLQASQGRLWFVLHTPCRQEKVLCEDLSVRGISHYLPLVSKVHYYRNRKLVSSVPLFDGYVFLLGSTEDAYRADRTGRVANIIPVFDQDRLNWELRNLQLAIQKNAPLDLFPKFVVGASVAVRSGPFSGLQGVVENCCDKRKRLILQVTTLGKSVSLEIDGSLLDLVN